MTSPKLSRSLEAQAGRLRQGWSPLLEVLRQGLVLVDAEGRFLEGNPAAARLLGLTRPQMAYRQKQRQQQGAPSTETNREAGAI